MNMKVIRIGSDTTDHDIVNVAMVGEDGERVTLKLKEDDPRLQTLHFGALVRVTLEVIS